MSVKLLDITFAGAPSQLSHCTSGIHKIALSITHPGVSFPSIPSETNVARMRYSRYSGSLRLACLAWDKTLRAPWEFCFQFHIIFRRLRVAALMKQYCRFNSSIAHASSKFRNTYDSDNTVFSPQGRLHQVEYALEAVKQGSAAVGLKSNTHAILLALKRSTGELASYQQKMFRIDDHVGIAIAGLTSDARVLSNFMRQQAMSERMNFNRPIPVNQVVSAIAEKAQVNTQEYGRRPYGVGFLVIGQDQTGPHLYEFSHLETPSLDELIVHGLHALRETLQQDKELTIQNTSIGIVGPPAATGELPILGNAFRILEGPAIDVHLKRLPAKEVLPGGPPAPAGDEDVHMAE
ncbi:hypothetical protein BS47DRAFT_1388321 [Hydnum rufescens UP504]|uniref:Proteasome alpha-type subunits domain-containing protein n=1 Tax=Hydnum rufescens UP504 TaxID=1448309 RepID=A0A9P6E1V9_9AGAM|nr:hypothetical protein BS47DRAFT_1388321 [Hydnum rufescens UP504]